MVEYWSPKPRVVGSSPPAPAKKTASVNLTLAVFYLFTLHSSLFTIHYSLFTIHYSSPPTPERRTIWIKPGKNYTRQESASGNIYTGVCVDSACTLGICAERNAIFQMLTAGEGEIRRVMAINREGKAIPPCGACRELMTQLMPAGYRQIGIMLDCEKNKVALLGDLTPEWWI